MLVYIGQKPTIGVRKHVGGAAVGARGGGGINTCWQGGNAYEVCYRGPFGVLCKFVNKQDSVCLKL